MSLIDAETLAKELGLTAKFVRRLALTEKIPAFRFGDEWRFDLQAVLESARYKNLLAESARRAARRIAFKARKPRRRSEA